ncbi:TonB-dependent receptor [Myroides sp. LJL115]
MSYSKVLFILFIVTLCSNQVFSQNIYGSIQSSRGKVENAEVELLPLELSTFSDDQGYFSFQDIPPGSYVVEILQDGYSPFFKHFTLQQGLDYTLKVDLQSADELDEIVISTNFKPMEKKDVVSAVEVYNSSFFQKNSSHNLFEAVQMINGVQPQLNCNVCNTGDIQINGMDGAYTMILIDGMPMVSSLSTVYGLFGIPVSLLDRIEVVKGPGSSLYGSQAMGGVINVITKSALDAPLFSVDASTSTWLENNLDLGSSYKLNKNLSGLFGMNINSFQNPIDKNKDGFTDVTQTQRISLFNKFTLRNKHNDLNHLAFRYIYEDRWGGQINKDKYYDGKYRETAYTNRFEVLGNFSLPSLEDLQVQFSYIYHQQNSLYGQEPYRAKQQVAFAQGFWNKTFGKHQLLFGASSSFTYYNDNTPGTSFTNQDNQVIDQPEKTWIQGAFIQDQYKLTDNTDLLLGYRFDYDPRHSGVHSPRFGFKTNGYNGSILRFNFGSGFRVVNVFTEDHRALSGVKEVVFLEDLKPEKSYNFNVNYSFKIPTNWTVFNLDTSIFYSHFTNKIEPDISSDPTLIIYRNLQGYAVSRGISTAIDMVFEFPFSMNFAMSYMDVFRKEEGKVEQSYHAPKWSGNVLLNYKLNRGHSLDFTLDWKGPMRLPIVENDYRPEFSPWVFLGNIQWTKDFFNGLVVYAGVKNIGNVKMKYDPISRWWDPFGEPANGILPPNSATDVIFEPNDYNYMALQGRRVSLGIRYSF